MKYSIALITFLATFHNASVLAEEEKKVRTCSRQLIYDLLVVST